MDIARYTIAKRTSVWVLIVLTLLGGYISYLKLGRFEDPEFVIRQAVINTPYSGATAQEVSDEVTDLIEGAVQTMQELKEVKSVSKQGMSEVAAGVGQTAPQNQRCSTTTAARCRPIDRERRFCRCLRPVFCRHRRRV